MRQRWGGPSTLGRENRMGLFLESDFASSQKSFRLITFLRGLWLYPICHICGGQWIGIHFIYELSDFFPSAGCLLKDRAWGHFKSLTVSDIYNLAYIFSVQFSKQSYRVFNLFCTVGNM